MTSFLLYNSKVNGSYTVGFPVYIFPLIFLHKLAQISHNLRVHRFINAFALLISLSHPVDCLAESNDEIWILFTERHTAFANIRGKGTFLELLFFFNLPTGLYVFIPRGLRPDNLKATIVSLTQYVLLRD